MSGKRLAPGVAPQIIQLDLQESVQKVTRTMERKRQKDFSSNIQRQKAVSFTGETGSTLRVQVRMCQIDPEPLEIWLSIMSLFRRSLNVRINHQTPVQQRECAVTSEKKKWLFEFVSQRQEREPCSLEKTLFADWGVGATVGTILAWAGGSSFKRMLSKASEPAAAG